MPRQLKYVTPSPLPSPTTSGEAVAGDDDTVNVDDGTPFQVFTGELVARVYWTADARNPDAVDGAAVDMAAHTRIYHELVDEWRRGNLWDDRWGLIPGRLWTHQAPPPPPPSAEDGAGGTPRRRSARLSAAAAEAASSSGVGRAAAAAPAPVTLPPYNPPAAKARERSAGGTVTLHVGRELVDSALESPFDYLRDGLGVAAARRRSEQLRKLHLGAVEAEAEADGEEEEVVVEDGAAAGDDSAPAPAPADAKTKTRRGTTKRALDDDGEAHNEDNTKKAEGRPKRQAKEKTAAAERSKRRR